ncbi:MAG: hypothetical protein LAN64_17805 [Acidobacteriia bacterium]|nr:hypothetical protein [Terriglobia bacterium]
MRVAHRQQFPGAAIGWGAAMNLFSLIFALILAVLFTILLLLFVEAAQRKAPPAPPEPHRAADLRIQLRP